MRQSFINLRSQRQRNFAPQFVLVRQCMREILPNETVARHHDVSQPTGCVVGDLCEVVAELIFVTASGMRQLAGTRTRYRRTHATPLTGIISARVNDNQRNC
jgi:hypothetical protein